MQQVLAMVVKIRNHYLAKFHLGKNIKGNRYLKWKFYLHKAASHRNSNYSTWHCMDTRFSFISHKKDEWAVLLLFDYVTT